RRTPTSARRRGQSRGGRPVRSYTRAAYVRDTMTLADRVRDDGESVSEAEVVTHWLREELEEDAEEGDEDVDVDESIESFGPEKRLSELLRRKPVAVATFDDRDLDWYRVDLAADELRGARVIKGDDDEGWREVADENTIESAARAVFDAESVPEDDRPTDPQEVDSEYPKDLETVLGVADDVAAGEPMSELVVVADEDPPFVADGNHRAVGVVLATLHDEMFPDQPAFVGLDGTD
ncbi:hypothetical protein ACFQE1_15640, partial [Halobium palmae]